LVTGARLSAAARWPARNCLIVSIRTGASPTRSPDPQRCKVRAGGGQRGAGLGRRRKPDTECLGAFHPGRHVKNFPAIHWEYQGVDSDNKTVYMARKMLFAGNSMIDVISMSLSLEVARRNGNDFIAVLEIEDFAPPAVTAAKL
jgi:hypothetical protein